METNDSPSELEVVSTNLYTPDRLIARGGVGAIYKTGDTIVEKVPIRYTGTGSLEIGIEVPELKYIVAANSAMRRIPFRYNGPSSDSYFDSFTFAGRECKITADDVIALVNYLNEGRILQSLQSIPQIVRSPGYKLCVDQQGSLFCAITLEYLPEKNLLDLLDDERFSLFDALKNIREISIAVQAMHQNGFVHRDVKPENVHYSLETGKTTLFDFNTSLKLSGYTAHEVCRDYHQLLAQLYTISARGNFGTPHYFAPEQFTGGGLDFSPAGFKRREIFSLGLTSVMILTRHLPKIDKNYNLRELRTILSSLGSLAESRYGRRLLPEVVDAIRIMLDPVPERRELESIIRVATALCH